MIRALSLALCASIGSRVFEIILRCRESKWNPFIIYAHEELAAVSVSKCNGCFDHLKLFLVHRTAITSTPALASTTWPAPTAAP